MNVYACVCAWVSRQVCIQKRTRLTNDLYTNQWLDQYHYWWYPTKVGLMFTAMCHDLNITWLGEPWTHSIFLSGLHLDILFIAVSWEVETTALDHQTWLQPFSSFLPFLFACGYTIRFLLHVETRNWCQLTASNNLNFWDKDGQFGTDIMASELLNRPLSLLPLHGDYRSMWQA